MSVYQDKRNGKWYYKFVYKGKQYHKAIFGADSEEKALIAENEVKHQIYRGIYNMPEEKVLMSLSDLVEKFLIYSKTNKESYKRDIIYTNYFLEIVGNKNIDRITPSDIEAYKTKRQNSKRKRIKKEKKDNKTIKTIYYEPIKSSTINRELNSIRKMFSLAVANEWINKSPYKGVEKLREENPQERFLSKEEEERLLKAAEGSYVRSLIIVALKTAMRRNELLNMKWENIHMKERYLDVLKTKSGKPRKLPIGNTLLKEFENIERKSEYVFTNPRTGKSYVDFKKKLHSIMEDAEIEGLRFHDIRHTAATRMVAAGVDLVVVKDILGHSGISTTMRYSHPVPEIKLEAMKLLEAY